MFQIMQGDAYSIPFTIKLDSTTITPSECTEVEIVIASFNKKYTKNEITYENNKWYFPISQAESFKLPSKELDAQIRVKFNDGSVKGTYLERVISVLSFSKDVI